MKPLIEIEGNRLYVKGLFVCYAEHAIPDPISGNCYISFSHRHGRNLILVDGKAWLGHDDGSRPRPDIVIGHVVGPDGLLSDPSAMAVITEHLQAREDDGLSSYIKVA